MTKQTDGIAAVSRLITDWADARAQLAAIERTEHPDIIDRHDRVWTWWKGDLYRHCGSAVPEHWVRGRGLPSQAVLDNPNYGRLCDICLDSRERNLPEWKPEWGPVPQLWTEAADQGTGGTS